VNFPIGRYPCLLLGRGFWLSHFLHTMTVGAQDAPLPFNLTDLDRQILAQTDEEFHPHSWDELKQIIGELGHLIGQDDV
jgi:hypothetical protein